MVAIQAGLPVGDCGSVAAVVRLGVVATCLRDGTRPDCEAVAVPALPWPWLELGLGVGLGLGNPDALGLGLGKPDGVGFGVGGPVGFGVGVVHTLSNHLK